MQSLKRKEQRKDRRKSCCVATDGLASNLAFEAFARNISLGGAFIETSQAFAINEDIFLLFNVRPLQEKPIRVVGKVVWNSPDGVGVEFTDVPEHLINMIKSFS